MLVGNVQNLDNYVDISSQAVKTINKSQETSLKENFIDTHKAESIKNNDIENEKKVSKTDFFNNSDIKEVRLYNQSFGYNKESQDFFVKVDRNTFTENQYPTEDMMKIKAFVLKEIDNR